LLASAHDHTDGVFLSDGGEPGRHNIFQQSLLNELRRSQKSDVETQQSLVSKLRKDHLEQDLPPCATGVTSSAAVHPKV